jgi:hypothetical protein
MILTDQQEKDLTAALDRMAAAKTALRAAKGTAEEPEARKALLAELDAVNKLISSFSEEALNGN